MTIEMVIAFGILIMTTLFFAFSKVRADFIAICCLLLLIYTDLLTPKEALAGFSNSAVIMIASLFIVGAGIFQSGLASTVSQKLMKLAGSKEYSIILVTMIVSAILSAFMSNTGTVAILLPVMISLSRQSNISVSKLLIPLSFASSLGGSMTLIGTPPNLMVNDKLVELKMKTFSFFSFTPIGGILLMVGILFILLFGRFLLPNRELEKKSEGLLLQKWSKTFKVENKHHLLKVTSQSTIIGKNVHDLTWASDYGIQILEIERQEGKLLKKVIHETVGLEAHFQDGDLLHVQGRKSDIEKITSLEKIELLKNNKQMNYTNNTFGMIEFVLTPDSSLIGSNLKQLAFRKRFGLNVLSIIQKGKVYHQQLHTIRLSEGDALLLHGKWEDIEKFTMKNEYGICLQLPIEERRTYSTLNMTIASVIVILMLAALVTEIIDPVVVTVTAALCMVVSGTLNGTKKYYGLIDWESIVLIAAMLPLSTALEKSGAVLYIANQIIQVFGTYGPMAILGAIYIATNLFSQFMSNTATAVLFTPIAITAAINLDISPYPMLIAVAVAASMAFSTPVASPTNAMVMNMGGYRFIDFMKIGIPLQIILGIIAVILIPIFFPF